MTQFLENKYEGRLFEKNIFSGAISESQKIYDDDFFELIQTLQ